MKCFRIMEPPFLTGIGKHGTGNTYTEGVQATNDDATLCKCSAVRLGYWKDPYISYFVSNVERKPPEINRGYYARVKGVELFINKFLQKVGEQCQIINLGAGFDTLYWRLKAAGHNFVNYVELDYPSVTNRKCAIIKKTEELLKQVNSDDGEVRLNLTDFHASNFHLIGVDLANQEAVKSKLLDAEIQPTVPTLFLAECVLVYIDTNDSHNLLTYLSSTFKKALFINYEQVNMNDKFGEVMLQSLRSRNCILAGVSACKDLSTQRERFQKSGWNGALSWNMVDIYNSLPRSERQSIERLEFFDELELLHQLFQHYSITVAWNDSVFSDINL